MRTEDQWNRTPYCCVCGSRTPVVVKDFQGKNNWYWAQQQSWKEQIVGSKSLLDDWLVYKFCGDSCLEVWTINPLVYEKRVSYKL